jgi:hypothetical protein
MDCEGVMYEFVETAKEPGDFTVVGIPVELGINYRLYECAAMLLPFMVPHYLETNASSLSDLTQYVGKAEWFLQAYINKDGFTCIDFNDKANVIPLPLGKLISKAKAALSRLQDINVPFEIADKAYCISMENKCPQ